MGRIAFFVQHMHCGGVENALVSLSGKLIEMGNDVTIYMITERGMFLQKLPSQVGHMEIPMSEDTRGAVPVGGTRAAIWESLAMFRYMRAVHFFIRRIARHTEFSELDVDFNEIPILDEVYDIAVDFHMHSPFLVRYLSEKVIARKKLTWIHNDFSTTKYDPRPLGRYLDCSNRFYGVSQKVVDEFTSIFPGYLDRTFVAHNIILVDEIRHKGDEYIPDEYAQISEGCLILLSVGRLEAQKGYDITIGACRELIRRGFRFQWFILGEGSERGKLERKVRHFGLERTLHFLGFRMNPYPYFKGCDVYVQTSKHEGYVTTVSEAKIFDKPVVCTDFAGAREQIEDGRDGDIAEMSISSVAEKLSRLLSEAERRTEYSQISSQKKQKQDFEWLKVFDI